MPPLNVNSRPPAGAARPLPLPLPILSAPRHHQQGLPTPRACPMPRHQDGIARPLWQRGLAMASISARCQEAPAHLLCTTTITSRAFAHTQRLPDARAPERPCTRCQEASKAYLCTTTTSRACPMPRHQKGLAMPSRCQEASKAHSLHQGCPHPHPWPWDPLLAQIPKGGIAGHQH